MPYLQPRTANYFGFMPYDAQPGGQVQTNAYIVSSSEGTAIFPGDVCILSTTNFTVRAAPAGTLGTSQLMVGIAASFLGANLGSTGSTGTASNGPLSSQMVLVYDSPHQLFVGCDTTSGLFGSTGLFKNVIVLTSGAVGSTGPNTVSLNRSVMAISGLTASSGLYPFKVIAMHPIEQNSWSTDANGAGVAASVRKYVLKPHAHLFGQGTGVPGQVTT